MDVATALTAAQTLFATLQCAEVRKLCSTFNYECELQKLLDTVEIIKNCLLDADTNCQELTNEGQYWVQNLKDAVYDADDLIDEFNTIAHQLKRMPGGKVMKKVRRFFSSNNQLIFAVNMSRDIKKLREKLDSLAKNHRDFGFRELYKPRNSREETCSYVFEHDIIGRDDDKEAIVDRLLKDDLENDISFVTVVGIGGLGKTALAQLVFNDHRIKMAFEDEMYWVCASENFGKKDILGKMLGINELGFEDLHKKVREQIEGKRFLLVLDDVWSESSRKWDEVRKFLILGGSGTRILVTSRSRKVAEAIGKYPVYELQGLSNEDSWVLFKKISLEQRDDEFVSSLVEIGKDILKKCANVPLSIRVIASLLRDQDVATWQSLKGIDLANLCDGEDVIMSTLMFSYYHLAPELKACFSFCSLFPEDHVINKTMLIRLWMALGYTVPSARTNESIEDVGEKYISILLHRCFFQDIKRNKFGEVESFKMHDLIHDLARKVATKEFSKAFSHNSEGKVRHLYIVNNEGLTTWLSSSNCPSNILRTLIISKFIDRDVMDAVISNCNRLRVLKFDVWDCNTLPDVLGKLLHLRYLDLSGSNLKMIPKSITKLHNLQTLKLQNCWYLEELPKDISKLVNLRVLIISGCRSLNHMPAGMGQLTSLHTLSKFVVCEDDEDKKGKIIDLTALLNNLRGHLYIKHYAKINNLSGSDCMEVKLTSSQLDCCIKSFHTEGQATLLDSLVFNHPIHEMKLEFFKGAKLPTWASTGLGLVRVELTHCDELQYLPSSLSQLCRLKYLKLGCLKNVEYIEINAPSPSEKFFPSLEDLWLTHMPALKGWWRDITWMEKEAYFIPSFPQLRILYIDECKGLTYFPSCPLVKDLSLFCVNDALTFSKKGGGVQSNSFSLERLSIDNSCVFNSLGLMEFVGSDAWIQLYSMQNLGTVREAFRSCSSVLRHLCLGDCEGIENLGIEHLPSLETLTLQRNIEGIPWKSLHSLPYLKIVGYQGVKLPKEFQYLTSLRSLILKSCDNLEDPGECINSLKSLLLLDIKNCHKLKSLSEDMRHLTSLITLKIKDCPELKSLPEALRHLTNLTTLEILHPSSPELRDRCQYLAGEDWPKICHIPYLNISWVWMPA